MAIALHFNLNNPQGHKRFDGENVTQGQGSFIYK